MTTSLLVLGGARSGKSRYAQGRVEAEAGPLVYIATAQAFDAEMTDRIARHQSDRDARWTTLEEPLDLAGAIDRAAAQGGMGAGAVLVDCLTLWLSNLMLAEMPLEAPVAALVDAIRRCPCPLVLVSNEVGLGIVPENALARAFRDEAGRLNQTVAAAVEEVQFIAAGLNLRMK